MYITPEGTSHVLWVPDRTSVVAAIPSRDGKQLAIQAEANTGNV
jgi:hypothetical protein